MYQIKYTSKFKRDLKLLRKQDKRDYSEVLNMVEDLQNGRTEHIFKDHPLEPKSSRRRECHAYSDTSDLILVYKVDNNKLILELLRVGSHAHVFESDDNPGEYLKELIGETYD